ncbi:MAG: hypothetical protein IJY78_07410, partial [Bacteroidaceae bacterium]|nr:hypothetical protein [Bacteroidaceae bacterium]
MNKGSFRQFFCKPVLALASVVLLSGNETLNAQNVTFYTPRTVRIEKPQDGTSSRESLVVIAKPERVKVKEFTKDGA